MLSFDGKLTINRIDKDAKDDKRMQTKGKECVNMLRGDIEEIAREEGIDIPTDLSKTKMCNTMLAHFEDADRLIVV
jgi:hypothetical protein